jgi:outer membrane protein assembly factor BamB
VAVACYDAADGRLRWQREVCEVPEEARPGAPRVRRHLLTLAAGQLVYCTHAGAIVALDARDGRLAWGVSYPSRGPTLPGNLPSPRDLAPAVFADGRLYVAPLDSDRLFCLDLETGRTLWERDRIEVVHLLGCGQDRLVFTTPQGIRAVGARTGADADGWVQPAEGRLPGYGRGLLAGGWVFWPTQDPRLPMRALNVEDGTPQRGEDVLEPTRLRHLAAGNLAYGDGCLVVAGVDDLIGYVPPERALEKRRQETGRAPSAEALLRLAAAEAGAGREREALQHLREAEKAAGDESGRDRVRRRRYELLLELARKAESTLPAVEHWPSAAPYIRQAADGFTGPRRLGALTRLAKLAERSSRPQEAVAVWQAVLREGAAGNDIVTDPAGVPRRATAVAADAIDRLIRAHGRSMYAAIETRAAEALKAKANAPLADIEALAREFPQARVVRDRLRQLAEQREQTGKHAEAARALRLYLHCLGRDGKRKAEAVTTLVSLFRAYEEQRCGREAVAILRFLDKHHGEAPVPGGRELVREYVAARLWKTEHGIRNEREESPWMTLPAVRVWQAPAGPALPPTDGPRANRDEEVFCVRDQVLSCRSVATGNLRWARELPFVPTWLGRHADRALVAGRRGVLCLNRADGRPEWQWLVSAGEEEDHGLAEIRLTGSHLLALEDMRRLLALDLDSGDVAWAAEAPSARLLPEAGGKYRPNYQAAGDWIVLQTTGGQRLVLAARTGRLRFRAPGGREPWPQPPLALGGAGAYVVESARRVLRLDTATGKEVWTYRPRLPTALTGEPPRLLGGPDPLFLCLPRNYGYDLERLDPQTGASVWPEAARLTAEPIELGAQAADERAVYFVSGNVLHARSLADGRRLWQRPLSAAARRWRLVRRGSCLVVYPREMAGPSRWRWLPLGEHTVALPLRLPLGQVFPVLLHDAASGRLVQRLNFETTLPDAAALVFRQAIVVADGNVAWGLGGSGDAAP